MILKLKNGVRYEESSGKKVYNPRQQFTRYYFEEAEQKFDMSVFQMKRTDEDLFKSHYSMLNLRQLTYYTDSLQQFSDSLRQTVYPQISAYYRVLHTPVDSVEQTIPSYQDSFLELVDPESQPTVIQEGLNQIRYIQDVLSLKATTVTDHVSVLRRYIMEYQRKFTLSVACLVLFSIGAPLGAIIRKGGLGLPVVMAIIFFLIFHIISTISEKSGREGNIDPVLGMWMAIIVLTPLGIFLTYKAATDSSLFDIEYYKLWALRQFNKVKSFLGFGKKRADKSKP